MSIADDPSQWTSPIKDNSLGGAITDNREHTLRDYHLLRDALWSIRDEATLSSSSYARRIVRMVEQALGDTPKEGNPV